MDIGAADNDEQREATYRFLNDEISAQHRSLMEEARGLDTKATVVAGFATAAVSFLLANRRETIWWFALAGYLAALVFALAALWPRRWHGLVPAALRDELSEAAPVFVVGEVAGTKVAIYERNYAKAQAKALLWTTSVVFLAVGSGLSVWTTITEKLR
ncbi:MAG: hypothetical protein ACRDHY_12985 [Anaerolineales bacterium]